MAASDQLYFPVEKNQVQILPQSFEYSLVSKTSFQVGDTLIDTEKFHLSIRQSKEKEQSRFFFEWPADFIREGELLLQDNSGKNIWIERINSQRVKIEPSINKSTTPEGSKAVRSSTSNLVSNILDGAVIEKLKSLPYFKFCIRFDENGTRIYLCSGDFFLQQTSNQLVIKNSESLRKDSFVEINGKTLDPQGLVFLSDVTDNLSLRVLMESGAKIEIDTHRKAVKFNDFSLSEDKKSITIKAEGAPPANRNQVISQEADSWKAKVNLERPILYLKGEGNIPMKQEFIVDGKIRKESDQIQIKSNFNKKTYSSDESLELKPSKDLKLINRDKKATLSKNLVWKFLDLEKGALNTRYLDVDSTEGHFIASYDIYRGYPIELGIRLMFPLFVQTQATLNLDTKNSFQLNYERLLNSSSSDNDFSVLQAAYLMNLKQGLRQSDSIWGANFFINQLQIGTNTTSLLGVGLYSSLKTDLSTFFQWINFKFELPLIKASSSYTLKTSYSAEASIRHDLGLDSYLETGLHYYSYSLGTDSSDLTATKTLVFVSLGFNL